MVHKLYNQILDIPIVMCSRFKMGRGGGVGGGRNVDTTSAHSQQIWQIQCCNILSHHPSQPLFHSPPRTGMTYKLAQRQLRIYDISLLFEILCARWSYSDRMTSHSIAAMPQNTCYWWLWTCMRMNVVDLPHFSAWLCGGKQNSCAFSYSFMLCWSRWCACWQMGFCSNLMYNLTTNKTWQKCCCSFSVLMKMNVMPPRPSFFQDHPKNEAKLVKRGESWTWCLFI